MISPLLTSLPASSARLNQDTFRAVFVDVMGDLNFQILRGYIFSELW